MSHTTMFRFLSKESVGNHVLFLFSLDIPLGKCPMGYDKEQIVVLPEEVLKAILDKCREEINKLGDEKFVVHIDVTGEKLTVHLNTNPLICDNEEMANDYNSLRENCSKTQIPFYISNAEAEKQATMLYPYNR